MPLELLSLETLAPLPEPTGLQRGQPERTAAAPRVTAGRCPHRESKPFLLCSPASLETRRVERRPDWPGGETD